MQTLSEIRALLAERGLRPKRRFGQNFLHDKNQLAKLVDAAGIGDRLGRDAQATDAQATDTDLVLEVGPGTGTLTEALLERGATVIACEIDADLAAIVRERLGDRITLVEGDCLARGRSLNPAILEAIGQRPFKLIANLPYQIASPLMGALLMDHPQCRGLFVTIQREVADRLLAKPGTKEYGPLTIIVQALASVEKIAVLPPSCFWPEPKVDSAMVAILPSPRGRGAGGEGSLPSPQGRGAGGEGVTDLGTASDRRAFARFITQLFTKRRKQLGTIFGRERTDWPNGVTPQQRPEALNIDQFIALWSKVRSDG